MTTEQKLCALTKEIWRYHLLNPSEEHLNRLLALCAEDMVTIGTGKNEFFTSRQQIFASSASALPEAKQIRFEIIDEWYECMRVTEDAALVYGGLWAREADDGEKRALVDMDTRFSVLYRRRGEHWELVHVHHSMPYYEQQDGESYPKTLSEKAREAMELVQIFRKKSETDPMTGLYNNESFKYYAGKRLEGCFTARLAMFDLDFFKSVNDTYGHLTGDNVLKQFARHLAGSFPSDAILGRIGGDEFAALDCGEESYQAYERRLNGMAERFKAELNGFLPDGHTGDYSAGIAEYRNGRPVLHELMVRADKALYRAKRTRGTTFCRDTDQ